MHRVWNLALAVFLLGLTASPVVAGVDEEKEAIAKGGEAFAQAFQAGDAKALAATWTKDGDYTDLSGKFLKGREAIEQAFTALFKAHKGLKLHIDSASLRFVTPEVAIEDGTSEVVASDGAPPSKVRYTIVHVKQDGQWMVSSVRDAPFVAPTNYEHLQELEPLVGEWIGEGKNGETEQLTISWTDNQNFIHATFNSNIKDVTVGSAHQWIAWDPIKKNVRSWIFDASGGFGEGTWSSDDNKWTIKTATVHRDGKKASATLSLVVDGDTLTLKSSDRTLEGNKVPGVRELKLKRSK